MAFIFTAREKTYWSQVVITCSQITFGGVWAAIFLPLDPYRALVLGLNLVFTLILWFLGWLAIKN